MIYLCIRQIFSEVGLIWILPVMCLHSSSVHTLNRKRKAPTDLLIPSLSVFFILFSLPQLAVFMNHILLYQPPDLLERISGLSLAVIASFKIVFYLICDTNFRRDLSITNCSRSRIAVPRNDY
eukprot:GFUD01095862.1.p1 GENE.GFUD01095862.1~~GFUD01095862.1.p1  ORF type:complete len:123 (-),score=16.05 GFUD01095862.1:74-442(-)